MQPGRLGYLGAFTRVELVAVLAALALLGAVVLPALADTRELGGRVACANNLRQIGWALLLYADDNAGLFPPRSATNRWPQRLLYYYDDTNLLHCPSDPGGVTVGGTVGGSADNAPRSYIINGWNDSFASNGAGLVTNGFTLPMSAIIYPSATVALGEKRSSSGDFYMDYMVMDDLAQLEWGRHTLTGRPQDGGSNHAMVDGSVQFLKYGAALSPVNLWAVTDTWRNAGGTQ